MCMCMCMCMCISVSYLIVGNPHIPMANKKTSNSFMDKGFLRVGLSIPSALWAGLPASSCIGTYRREGGARAWKR